MSLINKMLQDLETRKSAQTEAGGTKPVFEDLKPVKASSARAPSRRLPLIVLALVAVGAGAFAWMRWSNQPPSGNAVPIKQQTLAMRQSPPRPAPRPAPAVPPVAPAPAVIPVAVAKESPAPKPMLVAEKEKEKLVMKNPVQADPPAHAAVPATQKKAPAAPSKTAVTIKTGYWNVTRGETLYGISAKTGIGLGDLSRWNRLGRNNRIYPGQRLRLSAPPASSAKRPSVQNTQTGNEKSVDVAAASPAIDQIRTDTGVMDKKVKPLTPAERAESEYREAVDLLQKGHEAEAKQHLRAALEDSATDTRARELLAGLLVQSGHWREAEQILEQGIGKVPAYYPFAQLLARVYVDHDADRKALTVMERSREAGAGNADYMAFLAALYQRAGGYTEAINAYSAAIKLNPGDGRSWLGLGISFEGNQDWKDAGAAYQRAIESGVLDDKLLRYTRQRLAVVKNK
ncbi:MAG: tetratricopeptide repeat protein [Sulfuricaulis sp.]